MDTQDHHSFRLLREIETGQDVSQRRLASSAGIALGLTNLLVRRLAKKGFVKVVRVRPNRVRYLITPAGLREIARMSREYLRDSVRRYADARARIQGRFERLSAEWPRDGNPAQKRIAFYGAGELAEIGYVCLQATDFTLVAVADTARIQPFFGLPVLRPASLAGLRGTFDRLVVMSSDQADRVRLELEELQFPPEILFWI